MTPTLLLPSPKRCPATAPRKRRFEAVTVLMLLGALFFPLNHQLSTLNPRSNDWQNYTIRGVLRASKDNLIKSLTFESHLTVGDDEPESEYFSAAKRQYRFVRELHDRLSAAETKAYPDENEDWPWYRFARDGHEKRIIAFESA